MKINILDYINIKDKCIIFEKLQSYTFINVLIIFILIIVLIQLFLFLRYFILFFKKYFFTKELDLLKKYGSIANQNNNWVLITGCSSGQGKKIALEFAKRKFNIILVGSIRIINVEKIIKTNYNVKTHSIVVNFSNAYQKDFFLPIINTLENLDGELSILVNNVGHRVAWKPYHEMPSQKINDSIICGTIVQSRLTKIAIKHFLQRKSKSCIINITAMCNYSNIWFGEKGDISIPYLSVYEASNAFGYYHSNSIQKEYENIIDILNIIPGAVITENTEYLKNIPFSIDSDTYIQNIFKLIGNYNGPQYASWKHDLSNILCNFMFFYKDSVLKNTGSIIANNYMENNK